jgi:hypothetical protein
LQYIDFGNVGEHLSKESLEYLSQFKENAHIWVLYETENSGKWLSYYKHTFIHPLCLLFIKTSTTLSLLCHISHKQFDYHCFIEHSKFLTQIPSSFHLLSNTYQQCKISKQDLRNFLGNEECRLNYDGYMSIFFSSFRWFKSLFPYTNDRMTPKW